MSVQYANGAKNKPADFSFDKLMDMNAMQAFLDEQNSALTEEMNQKFGDIFESVSYNVSVFPNRLSPHLEMVTKNVLSKDIKRQCEEYLESYQKRFAKISISSPSQKLNTALQSSLLQINFGSTCFMTISWYQIKDYLLLVVMKISIRKSSQLRPLWATVIIILNLIKISGRL